MIGPLAEDEGSLKEEDEWFHRMNRHYYHWLNCGIRMGVSGDLRWASCPSPSVTIACRPESKGSSRHPRSGKP